MNCRILSLVSRITPIALTLVAAVVSCGGEGPGDSISRPSEPEDECTFDSDCQDREICELDTAGNQCRAVECVGDEHCGGYSCKENLCERTCSAGTCANGYRCVESTRLCEKDDGSCTEENAGFYDFCAGAACVDGACDTNRACSLNGCAPGYECTAVECEFSFECPDEFECLLTCVDDADCGGWCDGGVCRSHCDVDSQCPSRKSCGGSRCGTNCIFDSDCGGAEGSCVFYADGDHICSNK